MTLDSFNAFTIANTPQSVLWKYACIKFPLPGLVHIFVYNDSHLSLNQLYVLPNVCETCVITDYWQKNPQFLTLQLTHVVHRDNEGHKYSRPITLSKQPYIANAQCNFSFVTVSNCITFLKIRMHIGNQIHYFCNKKISAIQTKHNS